MEQLSAVQLRRSMVVLLELSELRELERYPPVVARLLRELIPCDLSSYTSVDPFSGQTKIAADPIETLPTGSSQPEIFGKFAMQNPLVENFARTGDGRALCISDFISRRQLHRTDLYDYVYRDLDVEYQLAVTLPSPSRRLGRPQEMIGLTLSRSSRDFSVRERQLLELLRPHLNQALERLHEVALASAMSGGEDENGWAMLIDDGANVALASHAAARDLGFLPGEPVSGELGAWVREACAQLRKQSPSARVGETTIRLGHRNVLARLRLAVHGQLHSLRLHALDGTPTASQLLTLGLTPRQAQVLETALQGRSSQQIAHELGLSRRTVEKHFEAIYVRLRVSGRSQALVHALQALRPG